MILIGLRRAEGVEQSVQRGLIIAVEPDCVVREAERTGPGAERGAGSGWRSDGATARTFAFEDARDAAAMLARPHPSRKLALVFDA